MPISEVSVFQNTYHSWLWVSKTRIVGTWTLRVRNMGPLCVGCCSRPRQWLLVPDSRSAQSSVLSRHTSALRSHDTFTPAPENYGMGARHRHASSHVDILRFSCFGSENETPRGLPMRAGPDNIPTALICFLHLGALNARTPTSSRLRRQVEPHDNDPTRAP